MISGVLPIDKSQGWTSHDVVAHLRRLSGQRQVGHAGTLDPLATGLLLIVLGRATRLSSYLMNSTKTYLAEIVLGAKTVTDDAEGALLERHDVSHLTLAAIEEHLAGLIGDILQVPPAYAAVRQGGVKLYALARKGIAVNPAPRQIQVYAIDVERWEPPRLRVQIRCGPGTYIRAIARDLGAELAVGGYLHALRRTASGDVGIEDSHALEGLDQANLAAAIAPPDRAVVHLAAAVVRDNEVERVRSGNAVPMGAGSRGTVRLYGSDGRLLALAECVNGVAKPFLVLA